MSARRAMVPFGLGLLTVVVMALGAARLVREGARGRAAGSPEPVVATQGAGSRKGLRGGLFSSVYGVVAVVFLVGIALAVGYAVYSETVGF